MVSTLLEPLIAQSCSETDRGKLQEAILGVCNKAYELRMKMRKSASEYRCFEVDPGSSQDQVEHAASDLGVLPHGATKTGGTVAITLFGGLMKVTASSSKQYVLEKAQVLLNGE